MVKIGKISDSVALESFRELDDFLKNKKEQAQKEIVEFLENSLVKDIFEIHQDFPYIPSRGSTYQEVLKKGNWFNIIDIIKSLVVSLENPDLKGISIEDTGKLIRRCRDNSSGNLNSISSFLINFSKKMISYDITNKCLSFNTFEFINLEGNGKKVFDFYDLAFMTCEDESIFTNGIKLLDFSKISSVESIVDDANDPLVFQFLKYIAGIITVNDLALSILAEIENEIPEIVSEWTTSPIDKNLHFHKFPAKFYSKEQIANFLVNNEENFKTFRSRGFFNGIYKSDVENNKYLRMILDEAFDINNINDTPFFSFLEDERADIIQGYSKLNSEDKKKLIFSKFKEFSPFNEKNCYNVDLLSFFENDEIFCFIKNTYKFLINKLKSDVLIEKREEDCLLVELDGESKYVKFYEDFFSNHTHKLSESQLSELKLELIPLLEEVQDKIYIKCYTDKGIPFNLSMSMKEIFDVLDIKNIHIFGSLFKTIDWYPKKIILVSDFSHPDDFVSAVERFSFIRKLSESEEFDISAILISELEWGYNHGKPMSDNNGTEWVYKRHQQLSGMIKRKISNGYLFSKSCTENFEEKQKFLDVVLSYNTRMPIYKIEVEE